MTEGEKKLTRALLRGFKMIVKLLEELLDEK